MTRPRTPRPVSRLIGRVWKLPDVGRVTAVTPTAALLAQADGSWPGLRLRTDWHHHWRWTNLMEGMEERFGLVDAAGHPVALWCGLRRRLLRLPTGAAYRLDYFEIDPRYRRGSLGLFAFAVAGTRALELDAQYLVFGALPPVATFYERAGGARGAVPGWNVARGLIPFQFTRDALTRLEDLAGGFAVGTEKA